MLYALDIDRERNINGLAECRFGPLELKLQLSVHDHRDSGAGARGGLAIGVAAES
jgi:hypothetical protein